MDIPKTLRKMYKRILYFDVVKIFAIFCVLWGHSIQFLSTNDCFENKIFGIIYSFHMPLFMILSGFFFSSSLKLSFKEILRNKLNQLILPILSWTVITIIYSFLQGLIINNNVDIIQLTKSVITDYYSNLLWFLKSLFVCYIACYICMKLIKNELITCFVSILAFYLLPDLFKIRFMLPFFWVGIFYKSYSNFIEVYSKQILIISISLFLFLSIFWDANYTIYLTNIPNLITFTDNQFSYKMVINIYRFILGTLGSVSIILLFKYLSPKSKIEKFSKFGQYTLGIYIIQSFVLIQLGHYIDFKSVNLSIYTYLITPLFAIVLFLVCILIIRIIGMNKYLDRLLLGKI